jgi:tryptophan synthase alpha chain
MAANRFSDLPTEPFLSVFFTAGFPRLKDTRGILHELQEAGVSMVEIGFPFSDPVADGPTIQASNLQALSQGMNLGVLFSQLNGMRATVSIPVLLMGYLNPVEQYGVEAFFRDAAQCGVDGVIVPDMPFEEYMGRYKPLYREYNIKPVFLVTSRTSEERIRAFDREQPGFIYVLSSDAITGGRAQVSSSREDFFKRLKAMNLASKLVVGFGVTDRESFKGVTAHSSGAIVGSAFIRALEGVPEGAASTASDAVALSNRIKSFVAEFL